MQIFQIDSKTFNDALKTDTAIVYIDPPFFLRVCYVSSFGGKLHDYYIEVIPGKFFKVRMGEAIPVEQFYRLKMATDRVYFTASLDPSVEF
jgi:hypothetical protein